MTIEQAIKKAVENGYRTNYPFYYLPYHLMNPLFWQALGRGSGWEDYSETGAPTYANGTIVGWRAMWHQFIEHLADRKSAEEFFRSLDNPQ